MTDGSTATPPASDPALTALPHSAPVHAHEGVLQIQSVEAPSTVVARALEAGPLKLELGCGQRPHKPDFLGIDRVPLDTVDIVHDLTDLPWPFPDGSVAEIYASHFVEHIPQDDRYPFMDEVWRVCENGATVVFRYPDGKSERAMQDPDHRWPPWVSASWLYYQKAWRELNGLTHSFYESVCDFAIVEELACWSKEWEARGAEAKLFGLSRYWNVADDRIVTLRAIKPESEQKGRAA